MGREGPKYFDSLMGETEGKDFERDLFGLPRIDDPEYQKKLVSLKKPDGKVPFGSAYTLIKTIQPERERPFAHRLREMTEQVVKRILRREDVEVRFFSALETPLDKNYSADAVIEIHVKDRLPIIVKLDASAAPKEVKTGERDQAPKKDVLIIERGWLNPDDEAGLQLKIPILARRIAKIAEDLKREGLSH